MISHQGDKNYLQEYAKYFQSRALRKLDPSVDLYGKKDTLVRLSKLATIATRGEFVPSETYEGSCQTNPIRGGPRGDLASRDDKTQPISLFQDQPRDHSPGGNAVRSISAFASDRRRLVA